MKIYICTCHSKQWSDKTHYNRHLNAKFLTGEPKKIQKKDYICELCGKYYRDSYVLSKHTSCRKNNTILV